VKTFFLKAEHWQVFSLLSALYVAEFFVGLIVIGPKSVPLNSVPISTVLALQGMAMITFGVFLGWIWAMGSFLNSLVRPPLRLSLAFFRFALLFPIVYGLAFPILLRWQAFNTFVFFSVHLFVMFCVFYAFRFVAKSLALQEETRFLTFRDYYPTFFQLWFAPIGIWWIQPKINRLYLAHAREGHENVMLESRT
jgi:hypothetical protein